MARRIVILIIIVFITHNIYGQDYLPEDEPLTINVLLQALGERLMDGKVGSIVAIDPTNGEVKCMVSASDVDSIYNHAIAAQYEPGSTIKTAQALVLCSEGIISPKSTFSCNKGFWRGDVHIGCHPHRSPQTMIGALSHSCNSYFCKAFMALIDNRTRYKNKLEAINTWHEYMTSMGLGKPLGIDMPGESGGLIPNAAYLEKSHNNGRWNSQTIMWMGMGQGEIALTPLQLCNLSASIANRGFYYIPHIHKPTLEKPLDVKYTEKHVTKIDPKIYEPVIEGMRAAVMNGTCASINTKAYTICGKTGTAENEGEDHSIFIGFAPMDKPKIAIAVYIEHGGMGADLAAPIASLMIQQYLKGKLTRKSEQAIEKYQFYVPPIKTSAEE
jgi:penicillin-binding protein 2